ncbi:Transposase [Sphingobium herbicidovorans NBRC 16415]|uniref:Transposase n=1 Tax=Sphingobium herbicidovorans (strain ATCC 700291 / DSM 11019 / CCUG 56400 / KCTC 2939 / LMG 18315 / NBRC 16415 / MH) TaxID=1219045 RepID=A0A086PBC4_SPHHM|nr:Transposase [Sphingobium herbicidovorans NBRC 16415]
MSDLYWLTDEQMARLSPYFPKSHSKPRVDAVEKAFSRPKARLPKTEERTVNGLWTLIGKLGDIFQPAECANYFTSCE